MGLYDLVVIDPKAYPAPPPPRIAAAMKRVRDMGREPMFQTKDLDEGLALYTIDERGVLRWPSGHTMRHTPRGSKVRDVHVTISRFGLDQHVVTDTSPEVGWWELLFRYHDGRLIESLVVTAIDSGVWPGDDDG